MIVLFCFREEAWFHIWQKELPQRFSGSRSGNHCGANPRSSCQERSLGHSAGTVELVNAVSHFCMFLFHTFAFSCLASLASRFNGDVRWPLDWNCCVGLFILEADLTLSSNLHSPATITVQPKSDESEAELSNQRRLRFLVFCWTFLVQRYFSSFFFPNFVFIGECGC